MALQVNTRPLAKGLPTGAGIGNASRSLRSSNLTASWSGELASALETIQARLDRAEATLRNTSPIVDDIVVTDAAGQVIGAIGEFIFNGVPTTNYFSEIHVGDPLNTRDPGQALFNANLDGSVTIGQSGWLDVLDPFGADAAWLGTQYDTQAITGAADNGSGLIRLTVVAHTLSTGDSVRVLDVGGVTNATGIFTVTKIGANSFDLQASVWSGTYTSGGTVDRLLHVTGAANNGSGLIRLTVASHGYESGDRVNVQAVGGVPNATGQWTVTVISASAFDLVGSTFGGTYTSGGTCLRYFAGGLFQTMAIGPSFANYKLRALADGSLKIRDADIFISGPSGSVDILDGTITLRSVSHPLQIFSLNNSAIVLANDSGSGVAYFQLNGQDGYFEVSNSGGTKDIQLVPTDGMLICTSDRPEYRAVTQGGTQPGRFSKVSDDDSVGITLNLSYNGSGFDLDDITKTGTYLRLLSGGMDLFYASPGINPRSVSANFSVSPVGLVDTPAGYAVSGVAGLSTSRSFGSSLTVNTVANGLRGTPGAGQSNVTLVTGVTLNLTSNTFSSGLLTL